MLNEKYFKKIIKLIRKYENFLDGHTLIISPNRSEFKLSYKKGNEYSESVWIAYSDHVFTGDRVGLETVYHSMSNELFTLYPFIL